MRIVVSVLILAKSLHGTTQRVLLRQKRRPALTNAVALVAFSMPPQERFERSLVKSVALESSDDGMIELTKPTLLVHRPRVNEDIEMVYATVWLEQMSFEATVAHVERNRFAAPGCV